MDNPRTGPAAYPASTAGSRASAMRARAEDMKLDAQANAKQVEGAARTAAETQKRTLAGRGSAVADAVKRLGEELDGQQEPWLGDAARRVAEGVQATSQRLEQRTIQELADDVRSLSRHPVAFLGGAFTIGLLAGRFLKASGDRSYDEPLRVPRPDAAPPLKPVPNRVIADEPREEMNHGAT